MGTLALGRAGCEQSHSAIHETLACACVWAALWRAASACVSASAPHWGLLACWGRVMAAGPSRKRALDAQVTRVTVLVLQTAHLSAPHCVRPAC